MFDFCSIAIRNRGTHNDVVLSAVASKYNLKCSKQNYSKRCSLVRTDHPKLLDQFRFQLHQNRLTTPGLHRWFWSIRGKVNDGWNSLQVCSPKVEGSLDAFLFEQVSLPRGVVCVINLRRQ